MNIIVFLTNFFKNKFTNIFSNNYSECKNDDINDDIDDEKYEILDFIFDDDFFCPICINTLHEDKNAFLGKNFLTFECKHTIHYKCLYEYNKIHNKNKCPLCNSTLRCSETENECFEFYCNVTRTWDDDPEKQKCRITRRRYIK